MKNRIAKLMIFSLLAALRLTAQDPSFTQFYAQRLYLNPAFAGMDDGLSIAALSRLQWLRADRGFQTHSICASLRENAIHSGLGLTLMQNTEGHVALRTTSASLTYAYIIPMRRVNLHIGLQSGWAQRQLDWEKIIFSDQLDPILGVSNPTSAIPFLEKNTVWQFDAGAILRWEGRDKSYSKASRHALGFALHHLPALFSERGENESFQGLDTRAAPRLTAHYGFFMDVWNSRTGGKIAISPNFKLEMQGRPLTQLTRFQASMLAYYDRFYTGLSWQNRWLVPNRRNTESVGFTLGFFDRSPSKMGNQNRLDVALSAELQMGGLGTGVGGTYEISFRWNIEADGFFRTKKPGPRDINDCKHFF